MKPGDWYTSEQCREMLLDALADYSVPLIACILVLHSQLIRTASRGDLENPRSGGQKLYGLECLPNRHVLHGFAEPNRIAACNLVFIPPFVRPIRRPSLPFLPARLMPCGAPSGCQPLQKSWQTRRPRSSASNGFSASSQGASRRRKPVRWMNIIPLRTRRSST